MMKQVNKYLLSFLNPSAATAKIKILTPRQTPYFGIILSYHLGKKRQKNSLHLEKHPEGIDLDIPTRVVKRCSVHDMTLHKEAA